MMLNETWQTNITKPKRAARPRRKRGELERQVIQYIRDYKLDPDNNGFSPSYRDIAEAIGCDSHMTVYNVIMRVVARNRPGRPATIDLDERGRIIVPDIEISLKKQVIRS